MQPFAKFISAVFHPFLMPLFTMFLLRHFDVFLSNRIDVFIYLTLIIVIITFATGVSILLMRKRGLISDLDIRNRSERFTPFLIVLGYYVIAYILTLEHTGIAIPVLYRSLMLGLVVSILTGLIVTMRFKLSMHLLAIGGVLASVIYVGIINETSDVNWISSIVIASGLLAWSRLELKAHTLKEVYVGFSVGFLCMLSVLMLQIG
jgi:hypothetical protein